MISFRFLDREEQGGKRGNKFLLTQQAGSGSVSRLYSYRTANVQLPWVGGLEWRIGKGGRTVTAPRGVEFEKDRHLAVEHNLIEVLGCQINDI